MVTVESLGSYWFIDPARSTYRRTPKREQMRENPEWGGPEAGPLQDLVEQPFTRLELIKDHPGLSFWDTHAALRIHIPGPERGTPLGKGAWVHAPISEGEFDRLNGVLV